MGESLQGARILVTGGAGFIGSHLCELLCRQGRQSAQKDTSGEEPGPQAAGEKAMGGHQVNSLLWN